MDEEKDVCNYMVFFLKVNFNVHMFAFIADIISEINECIVTLCYAGAE